MEIADKKEDEIVFCDTESMEQQKACSRQRNGLGIEPVGVALGHIHNVVSLVSGPSISWHSLSVRLLSVCVLWSARLAG